MILVASTRNDIQTIKKTTNLMFVSFVCLPFVVDVAHIHTKRAQILLHLFTQFMIQNRIKLIQIALEVSGNSHISFENHFWVHVQFSYPVFCLFKWIPFSQVFPNKFFKPTWVLSLISFIFRILLLLFLLDIFFLFSWTGHFLQFLIFKLKTYQHKMI